MIRNQKKTQKKRFQTPLKHEVATQLQDQKFGFKKLPTVHKLHFTNGIDMLYRRLSMGSLVADESNTKLGVTNWKWYCEKSKDVSEEYKIGVSDENT